MGHWFLIVIIVPNGLVKQLLHSVKVAIKKALKRLIEGITWLILKGGGRDVISAVVIIYYRCFFYFIKENDYII